MHSTLLHLITYKKSNVINVAYPHIIRFVLNGKVLKRFLLGKRRLVKRIRRKTFFAPLKAMQRSQ